MARHQDSSQKALNSSEVKNLSCRFCSSENIIKRGYRKTTRGMLQRYQCKKCKKRFIVDDGFLKMRNTPEKITQSLHLYFSGTSLRKTQEHLGVFHSHNASHMTVLRWIRKYATLVGKFTDSLKLNVGEELMNDEMEEKVMGIQHWFVDVMDTKTRYLVSSGFMRSRTIENLVEVMKDAKNKTGEQIKVITTDGLNAYPRVLRKSFCLNKREAKTKIHHNVCIASER